MKEAVSARIMALHRPFAPVPTGVAPVLPLLPGIKAVVFDVYGTIMLSAAGDIGVHEPLARARAFADAVAAVGGVLRVPPEQVAAAWFQEIKSIHDQARRRGMDHPEIDVRDVWATLVAHGLLRVDSEVLPALAIEFEMSSNPVSLEPDLRPLLAALRKRRVIMGIVSNAQFYTPVILESLLGVPLTAAGFTEQACIWSYRLRRAKPSIYLYQRLAAVLAEMRINPAEVLYIGNDMLNDIVPASRCGLRTGLYAGDARSLRMRAEHPDCAGLKPDAVYTTLGQVAATAGCG